MAKTAGQGDYIYSGPSPIKFAEDGPYYPTGAHVTLTDDQKAHADKMVAEQGLAIILTPVKDADAETVDAAKTITEQTTTTPAEGTVMTPTV